MILKWNLETKLDKGNRTTLKKFADDVMLINSDIKYHFLSLSPIWGNSEVGIQMLDL